MSTTDNVQPLNPTANASLPDLGNVGASAQGQGDNSQGSASAQESGSQGTPMPIWFKFILLFILLLVCLAGYIGYLAYNQQLPFGSANHTSTSPSLPPAPQFQEPPSGKAGPGTESSAEVSPQVPGEAKQTYKITLTPPGLNTALDNVHKEVADIPGHSTVAPGTADQSQGAVVVLETSPKFTELDVPQVNRVNIEGLLEEHGSRILSLEMMTAEHAELLKTLKAEVTLTRQQSLRIDKTVKSLENRIAKLGGKIKPVAPIAQKQSTNRLPFTPMSYKSFGDQISVRVKNSDKGVVSLRIGQALSGWRLLSADPIKRTAVFLNVKSFAKREVVL